MRSSSVGNRRPHRSTRVVLDSRRTVRVGVGRVLPRILRMWVQVVLRDRWLRVVRGGRRWECVRVRRRADHGRWGPVRVLRRATRRRACRRRDVTLVSPGRDGHRRVRNDCARGACPCGTCQRECGPVVDGVRRGRREAVACVEELKEPGMALCLCNEEVGTGELGTR